VLPSYNQELPVLAIVEAWRAGLLGKENWLRNLSGGVIVGIVAVPLAMAFAIASGAKPEQGLYTAVVAGLVVTLFGGSRVQIAGPTGAFAVLLFGITAKHGLVGLQVATVMAGLMLLGFGIAKLGSIIRFIPESVILGFTAGIAVVIWLGQWEAFFGLPAAQGAHFVQKLFALVSSLPLLDPATTAIGVGCVLVIALWPRIPVLSTVPSPLVALVAATILQSVLQLSSVDTIGTAFGGVPRGLPALQVPEVSLALVVDLLRPAFAIALLGAIESLLSATVADGMIGTRHDSNQELVAQGLANVASGALGGFAATGALARTATNVRHGGNSPLAGIVHVAVVILVLVALAPLAYNVPMAALAAILFVVAFNMSDLRHVAWTATHAPRTDVAIMLVTLLLTVFADLVLAVEVGVALAMVNFLRRMARSVEVRQVEDHEMDRCANGDAVEIPVGTLVYTIEGPFFFGAIEQFEAALVHTHTVPDMLVLNLSRVPFIDLTGLASLREAVEALRKRDVEVAICNANTLVARKLERDGVAALMSAPVSAGLCEVLQAAERRAD
jgi:SulP family sulfate permease